jgi:hypothetical protein
MMKEIRNVCTVLVGKHEVRLLQRPKHRWQDDVNIDFKGMDLKWTASIWFSWIVSSGRYCAMLMNLQFLLSGQMTVSA